MNCLFLRRSYPEYEPPVTDSIIVTIIHGTDGLTYVTHDGAKYYATGSSFTIKPGDIISFHLFADNPAEDLCYVRLRKNGTTTTIFTNPDDGPRYPVYNWTVPDDVLTANSINLQMNFDPYSARVVIIYV